MINECKAFLRKNTLKWQLPPGGEWTFLFFNNTHPHVTNLDLLWFHDDATSPAVVTKFCPTEAIIRREFENLTKAHDLAPALVPQPLGWQASNGFFGLWMRGVDGFPLLPGKYRGATLRHAVETLASMHNAFRSQDHQPNRSRYRRVIAEPLESIARFGEDPAVGAFFTRLRTAITEEWLTSLPIIPQHGDLFPGNLLFQRDEWRIVDWESFGTIDLPTYDLLTLFLALLWEDGDAPSEWNSVLTNELPGLIELYAGKLGLSKNDLSLLLPISLANWFHLQLVDGRQKFTERMYRRIQQYVQAPQLWEQAFLRTN